MGRLGCLACLAAAAVNAAFIEPPVTAVRPTTRTASFGPPLMIIEKVKEAAKEVERSAAESIVAQKVSEKLARAKEKYTIPEKYVNILTGFFTSYMTEIYLSGNDVDKYEAVLTEVFQKVLQRANEPHVFEPYHKAMREPYDYYELGNQFAEPLVKNEESLLLGLEQIEKIRAQVAKGENVVLLANHQSEADPQIFSVLLDPLFPGFAESTIFVAGDRGAPDRTHPLTCGMWISHTTVAVTTDLLAQPFSMGRNLLCIFSKKHVDNPPELKASKMKHNRNVMKEMKNLFKEGGKLIWVAPSGGRDRKDSSGQYSVAPFDAKSVEMFRLMADKSGRETHFYPLSMLTYPICPPPEAVGGAVGEQRTVKWSPAGLHFGEQIDLTQYMQACIVDNFPKDCDPAAERDAVRDALTAHIQSIVATNYDGLAKGLEDQL